MITIQIENKLGQTLGAVEIEPEDLKIGRTKNVEAQMQFGDPVFECHPLTLCFVLGDD